MKPEPGDALTTQARYDRQARLYDITEAPVELLAFRPLRRTLWSEVTGPLVLEVGVGTGKNFGHHPERARMVGVDLSPRMLARAGRRARESGRELDLILADAQHLPFRDDAFDTAAATFVFCSVPDPVAGLAEVQRVVRANGGIHLLEHVRAGNAIAGRIMDLANPVAVRLSGANVNRDTVGNVGRAGIAIEDVLSRWLGIIKLIRATASGRHPDSSPSDEPTKEVE